MLLHDGPGQGRLLVDDGLPLRHDWEKVVTPVVDAALNIDVIDPERIVYHAWSLGGYFAPRVAAYEHRLAALVADPGQLDVGGKLVTGMKMLGLDDAAIARLPAMNPADEQKVMTAIDANRALRWKIVQRGFWTNGASGLPAFIAEMDKWKLSPDGVAAIRCPTLVTTAQSDPVSSDSKDLYDALKCPKTLIEFTDADGAGMHCELLNRSMANRQILDWLDETLGVAP